MDHAGKRGGGENEILYPITLNVVQSRIGGGGGLSYNSKNFDIN